MTSLSLLSWIVLAIAVQLAVFLAFGFRRHWRNYEALQAQVTGAPPAAAAPAVEPGAGWPGWRPFRVERKAIEDGAASVCSFYLVPEDGRPLPAFLPGQFLTFRLDLPDATQLTRCYSLSAAPRPDHYRISVKRVPGGRASNHLHDRVGVGDRLQVRAPGGHFHIDRSDAPVVLIAGGIGITPMLSMVDWCLAECPGREVWLFYGVRTAAELVLAPHLEALAAAHANFRLRLCLSDPAPADLAGRGERQRGRVDLPLLRLQLPLKPYHFYVCGPTAMMESIVAGLGDWGVPSARIHYEAFGPASVKPRAAAATTTTTAESDILVTFAKSGKQVPWQPAAGSLLELAEANGIAVDSGCRSGGCGSCQTTIRSGEAAYPRPPDYDPEPGTCLLCSAVPKTSITLEA